MDKEEIRFFKRLLVLIFLLTLSLGYLYLNKAQSYERYERIEFQSSGATLYANLYYPSKVLSFQETRPLIIYCHGIGSQRDFDLRIPIEFTKRGFYVAALDYQGHGESGGSIISIDPATNRPALAEDCSKLLDKLETLPFFSTVNQSQIGLIGHSLGGMVVLMNQALDPRFNVTVAWAPLVNFDPQQLGIIETDKYNAYVPVNLLNQSNTHNLLVIMHVNDEALNFTANAVKTQELTNCTLISITQPVLGSPHQLFLNDVLISSIQWFESHFFNSETINGPIYITFLINYISIFMSLALLFMIVFLFISYSHRLFITKPAVRNEIIANQIPSHKKLMQVIKVIFYCVMFVVNWEIFERVFGLPGIFYASLNIIMIYELVKFANYFRKYKKRESNVTFKDFFKAQIQIKNLIFLIFYSIYFIVIYFIFTVSSVQESSIYIILVSLTITILGSITISLTILAFKAYLDKTREGKISFNIKNYIQKSIKLNYLLYAAISSLLFIGFYLLFSISYPFAFMWPSNYINYIVGSITAFPVYFSMEILYRKIIYPKLNFIRTEKSKSIITVLLALYVQINLITLTWSWAFFPSVVFTYFIFLLVIIQNTLIFEHSRSFSAIILSSFLIIQIFFSAVVSNAIGIGAALHLFVNI
jgi:dienelactone hydrolase